jgi:spore maturation protein CgeB
MKLKLLLVGQELGKYYTGLADSYVRAFSNIKMIETHSFDIALNINNDVLSKIINRINFAKDKFVNRVNLTLLKKIWSIKPDIILVIKGANLLPTSINLIKSKLKSTIIVCYNPDNPLNISNRGSTNFNIIKSIPLYDIYFTYSKTILNEVKKLNGNSFYIPFAADTKIIYPIEKDCEERYLCDISFIGDIDEERKNIIDQIISVNKNFKLRVYGLNIKLTKGIDKFGFVEGKDFLCALIQSKINLNLLRIQNKNSHNMRTFEIPAAKGFMLHERSEEAMEFFVEGKEADYFSTAEELNDKTNYYLNNDEIRKKIALAGYNKIFSANYTYGYQAKRILDIIKEYFEIF